MNYVFIVQGEGRGHMTQAIALSKILRENGHTLSKVFIGKSPQRRIPDFVYERMGCEVVPFDSPNFITDDKTKSIRLGPTIAYNLWHARRFFRSIAFLNREIKKSQPDVIVNFYDLLAGMYFKRYAKGIRKICIGHQYLVQHPDFDYPQGKEQDVRALRINTAITSWNADKKLALSFRPLPDHKNVRVVPPLLRELVLKADPQEKSFILAYLNNNGFAEEIIAWQKEHPEQEIHCFWDKKEVGEEWSPQSGLTFHQLDDVKFMERMKSCQGFCSTAGFEAICEAMYLGKPVMMVPIHNHIEQECNAIDAVKSGAGISANFFDLDRFAAYLPDHESDDNRAFQGWVGQAEDVFLAELTKKS